ncbi:exonuclease SbcCD subunit D C-terminal domain-containing protein [Marinomonas gallaica]|uniref:exonuclease SbcCD subunit D C-terminal domain-containing protein n=1 Tax=Marinomonas gallaica TaxID=1806667 RepID=UPI000830C5A2|nr:exonuclease SbcCD subunit D C-terminal domain-containing protein [Marinomonas gallaica]
MKILHTSDWHLGQSFMGKSRLEEHRLFVSWLANIVEQHHIKAVILAGDVFDTSTPPSYARELYHECVLKLNALNCQFIVVAGNHDSVSVLNESKSLLRTLDTYVVTQPEWAALDNAVIPLRDEQNTLQAMVCAVPFLRARDMVRYEAGQAGDEKQQLLSHQIQHYYRTLFSEAKRLSGDVPIIGTGHFTVLGGQKTESVRDIYVGTLEAFPPSMLPEFDYLALGHIHKPMSVGGNHCWRYSGSPMPMSFDEASSQKSVCVFDTETRDVERIDVPAFRELRSMKGSRDQLIYEIEQLPCSEHLTVWLEITVTEDINLGPFQEQLRQITEHKKIDVVKVRREKRLVDLVDGLAETATLEDVTPVEVFDKLLLEKDVSEERSVELRGLFQQIIMDDEEPNS